MDNNMTFLNACRNGQKGIVQIFLKKGGIDVNKRDAEGNTPLHYACLKGYRDIVNLLLDSEADATHRQQPVGNTLARRFPEREQGDNRETGTIRSGH